MEREGKRHKSCETATSNKLDTNVQNQPIQHPVFSIGLIVDCIFTQLPKEDLLSCSGVSRFWNSRARIVLRDRRICMVEIGGNRPCEELKQFEENITNASYPLPYNGLSITILKSHKCIRWKDVSFLYRDVLEKVPLKYLSIHWAKDIPCPCVAFVRTLFKDKVQNLQCLTLSKLPYGEKSLGEHFNVENDSHWLPRLKRLQIPPRNPYDGRTVERSQIFEIVAAAPNLEVINGLVQPEEVQYFLSKRKAHAVTEFEFRYGPGMLDLISDFATAGPRLRRLDVTNIEKQVLSWEDELRLVQALDRFLQSSADKLEELMIDGALFMLQYHLQIPKISQLKTLHGIEKARVGNFPYFTEAFKLNFGSTFPLLETVEVDEGFLNLLVHYSEALYGENVSQFSADSVKSLRIIGNYGQEKAALRIVSALFPNVKDFRKSRCSNPTLYFSLFAVMWPDLESVSFEQVDVSHWRTLATAAVCGITSEEATELETMDPGLLQSYQFAPTQPSIISLSKLTSFRAEVVTSRRHGSDLETTSETFPTAPMKQLTFSRMPALDLSVVHFNFVWIF